MNDKTNLEKTKNEKNIPDIKLSAKEVFGINSNLNQMS